MPSRSRCLPTLLAGLLAAMPACQRGAQVDRSDALAESVIVLPGATNVRRETQGGASGAAYELDAAFPAAGPIVQIVTRLNELGWTPLKEDSLNPGIPTSMVRSWTSFVDASGPKRIQRYSWSSDWKNVKDDRTHYAFTYEAPEASTAGLRHLNVMASFYPANVNRQVEADAAGLIERYNRASPRGGILPPASEGPGRTLLEAPIGATFLASGPAGEAVVQVTGETGGQVAYRWRFRDAGGKETSGAMPAAATLQAGPFRLQWMSQSPLRDDKPVGGVGFHADEMDLIRVPADQFATLDLGEVHTLATLLPDRNLRYSEVPSTPERGSHDRFVTLLEAGSTVVLGPGRALFIQGAQGRGVIEVLEPELRSVKYRWRFRGASSDADESGEAVASDGPLPNLSVGPYSVQWQLRLRSEQKDEQGSRVIDWAADVKYLPEEISASTLPADFASRINLATKTPPAPAP